VRPPKENFMNDKKTDKHMTQEEVAKSFGMTRIAIQQIEKRALEKFKKEIAKRGIKKEDYLGE
jgi:DNA-directed RNA polymerase sigma subunit (sigma70/sigma32)